MVQNILTIINADMVTERHYFLETLNTPQLMWGIRGICVLMGITALVIYFKMKRRDGE